MIIPGAPNPLMWGQGDPIDEFAKIERSLRFRPPVLSRVSQTNTTQLTMQKITFSWWQKRGELGTNQCIFGGGRVSSGGVIGDYFGFNTNNQFQMIFDDGVNAIGPYTSSEVFRDVVGWEHIVLAFDTTQAVQANRMKLWRNDRQVTISNGLALNANLYFMYAVAGGAASIGCRDSSAFADYNLAGYIAHFACVVDQSLTPSSFGRRHPITGQWRPRTKQEVTSVVNTGTLRSFFLPFDDVTSLTTLCLDASNKGNNFTATNISLTPGATYDSMLDTPTTNWCVLNSLATTEQTITNGGLTATSSSGAVSSVHGSISIPPNSRLYAEFTNTVQTSSSVAFGCGVVSTNVSPSVSYQISSTPRISGFYASNGHYIMRDNGTNFNVSASALLVNDVIQIAVYDNKLWIGKNNVWWDNLGGTTGNPSTGENPTVTLDPNTTYIPYVHGAGNTVHANFGQRSFTFTPPLAFISHSAKNLPFPRIVDPSQHHTVVTVTKSGDTNFTIPWDATAYDTFFEIKRRDASGDWYQIDGLRGYDKYLTSTSTAAEVTNANVLGVSGFTGTLKSTLPNGSYVISMHKAGLVSARATNTDGTITSVVSVNQISGFSIATYTGTGANGSFGHGLGRVPAMETIKSRTAIASWPVQHKALATNDYLLLNSTSGVNTSATVYNGNPTSTVVNVGTDVSVNVVGVSYVAYIHAEVEGYSNFGSYTGTGNSNGPFLYSFNQPCYARFKRTDPSTLDWHVFDTARSPFNAVDGNLASNNVLPESNWATTNDADFVSNGIKLRHDGSTGYDNYVGATFIFEEYAQFPFRYANAR